MIRVLVVDDSVDSAETVAELLRIWGHDVRVVHDGASAVTCAREYGPEIVLLDIGLPDMDGFAVAEALKKDGFAGRLIAVTGYGEDRDRQRAQEVGIDRHLVKPVDPDQLQKVIAQG